MRGCGLDTYGQDRDQRQALVNIKTNLEFQLKAKNALIS